VQSIPPSPASRSAYRHPPSHPLHPINMAEFMFVNLNNPTQNKRREVRKLVRSHVSYMQHSQKRTELGQVQKPSKSRYTDRSVNGWAVLDDSIAARSSQLKVDSASGLNSGLLPQHQSTVPGSSPITPSNVRQGTHSDWQESTPSKTKSAPTESPCYAAGYTSPW
jgi:hypothetical protein